MNPHEDKSWQSVVKYGPSVHELSQLDSQFVAVCRATKFVTVLRRQMYFHVICMWHLHGAKTVSSEMSMLFYRALAMTNSETSDLRPHR